jgi:hypothetical protein
MPQPDADDKKKMGSGGGKALAVASSSSGEERREVKGKAKALYDYAAAEAGELPFKKGDVLSVTMVDESGWWEGEFNGAVGLFPGNHVQMLDDNSKKARKKVKILFDFDASSPDELTVKEGQTISVESENQGWYIGVNEKGETGLFPANYAEPV